MFRVPALPFAALALLAMPAFAARIADYFADRSGLDKNTMLYLDAWSGQPDRIEALRTRLNRNPPPADAADGWSLLCDRDYHVAQYAKAISDCKRAIALAPHGGSRNTLAIVKLLVDQPPPRALGAARVPVSKGVRVPVTAGGYRGVALADTGAQISVMMRSVAKAAKVKMLGNSRRVDSTTSSVSGKIGLIPRVRLGNAVVENIPVLVLPDSKLEFHAGKTHISLPFILSLYALADFGRIAWLDHDKWLAVGGAAPSPFPGAVPMIWHPNGIAVPLQGVHGRRSAQFDSGADVSWLYDSAIGMVSNATRATLVEAKRKIGGLGGVVEQKVRRFPGVTFTLAGQPLTLKDVDVVKQPATGEAARLGEDVLSQYAAVVFDFRKMTFSISP